MKKTITLFAFMGLLFLGFYSCKNADNSKPGAMPSDSLKAAVVASLDGFAGQMMMNPVDTAKVFDQLQSFLDANTAIYGSALALAPPTANQSFRLCPYMYRTSSGYSKKYLEKSYDYSKEGWYTNPVAQKKGCWTEPYFDKGGGEVWMITYSVPLFNADSTILGVLTSDLEMKK